MGRKSTVDRLPDTVRDDLLSWLEDPVIDIDEAHERVNAVLDELGLSDLKVSRSAVGRKARKHHDTMQRLGEQMREAKANREMFYQQFGSDLSDGGKFLAETLQAFIFRLQMKLHELDTVESDDLFEYSKIVKNLTGSIVQTEEALTKHHNREADVRRQALEEAAANVEKVIESGGSTAEQMEKFKTMMGM